MLNGVGITVLNLAYLRLTKTVVDWENHKYESAALNSLILKNFFFQFSNSYIYIAYNVVFTDKDFVDLEKEVLVIMGTAFVSRFLLSFAMPYGQYLWKKRAVIKKWTEFCSEYYDVYFKNKEKERLEKLNQIEMRVALEAKRRQQKPPVDEQQENDIEEVPEKRRVYVMPDLLPKEDTGVTLTDYTITDQDAHKQIEYARTMQPEISPQECFTSLVNIVYS